MAAPSSQLSFVPASTKPLSTTPIADASMAAASSPHDAPPSAVSSSVPSVHSSAALAASRAASSTGSHGVSTTPAGVAIVDQSEGRRYQDPSRYWSLLSQLKPPLDDE